MGKFIITEEEKKSIRGLYGLNEQTNSLSVSSGYTATNCDELHAFQGTSGKDIGNMNGIVAEKIKEWNSTGINVKPTNVTVSVNGMTVNWNVTFVKNDINWVGFTSRGAGCNDGIDTRAGDDSIDNGPKNVVDKLKEKGKIVDKIEVINDYKYNGGNNSFKQVFYRYTLVDKTSGSKPTPTTPQPKTQQNAPETESINGNSLGEFRNNLINGKTADISIDENSVNFSHSKYPFNVKYSTGETKINGMTLVFDPSKTDLDYRIETNIKELYPNLIRKKEWKGISEKVYYEFLILKK